MIALFRWLFTPKHRHVLLPPLTKHNPRTWAKCIECGESMPVGAHFPMPTGAKWAPPEMCGPLDPAQNEGTRGCIYCGKQPPYRCFNDGACEQCVLRICREHADGVTVPWN